MSGQGQWQVEPAEPSGPSGPPGWINVGIVVGVVAIVGMAAAIVILLVTGGSGDGDDAATDDPTPTVPSSTTTVVGDPGVTMVPVGDVAVGMCINLPDAVQEVEEGEAVDVTDLPSVDCETAHDLEAYDAFDLEDGVWRGSEAVLDEARQSCEERFEGFVGLPFDESDLAVEPLRPTIGSWEGSGDRRVTCMVTDPAGQTVGSLQGVAR